MVEGGADAALKIAVLRYSTVPALRQTEASKKPAGCVLLRMQGTTGLLVRTAAWQATHGPG